MEINNQSFWSDDPLTPHEVHIPLAAMIHTVLHVDTAPPLYFVLIWTWVRLRYQGSRAAAGLDAGRHCSRSNRVPVGARTGAAINRYAPRHSITTNIHGLVWLAPRLFGRDPGGLLAVFRAARGLAAPRARRRRDLHRRLVD